MRYVVKTLPFSIAVVFLICCLWACKKKQSEAGKPKNTPPVIVDVIIAERQAINDVVEANGTVVANEFLELHPEVTGRLTYLNISEGSAVSEGTILAKINDADLQAQLAKTKVQLDLAQKTTERYKQLLDVSGINQSDYDIALNQVNAFKADMVYTQALINKTVLRAPFSGIIGLRQVSPGAFITSATTLATLQQTSKIKIDFTIPQNYSNIIKQGAVVDVELYDNEHTMGRAMIVATEPGANTATRNLKVRALLSKTDIIPGAFVKVFLNVGAGKTSIIVPTNCIIPNDKDNQVVVVKNGLANFVNVQTGIRQSTSVEITKGLNVGDSVVVSGVLFAKPTSKLNVRAVKKLADLSSKDSSASY
ncbi:MAG: efflux RND transporter periplasmic adaptor subunit [Ferruginibacter sp.]